MENTIEHRPNRLGLKGWFWGGNYKLERYLFITHRITGLCTLLFFGFHLYETTVIRLQGQSIWQAYTNFMKQPLWEAGLLIFTFIFVIHALNGLRLLVLELGGGLGKPRRPVYPHRDSLRRNRAYTFLTLGAIILITLLFLINPFLGGRG